MAIEVMEMLLKIGLQNEAMSGLDALSNMLKQLEGMLDNLQKKLAPMVPTLVEAGVKTAALGVTMAGGLSLIGDAAGEVTDELVVLKNILGEIGATKIAGAAWNATHAVGGTTYRENLKLAGQMAGLGLSPEQITAILPEMTRAAESIEVGGRSKTAYQDLGGLIGTLGRSGLTDPARRAELLDYIDAMARAVQASGGGITVQDYIKANRFGGVGMLNQDQEFNRFVLPALMQAFKSPSSGMIGMQGNIGSILDQALSNIIKGQGKEKGPWAKYLPGVDLTEDMLRNPMSVAQAIGPTLMEQAGGDANKLHGMLRELFGRQAAALMAYMIEHANDIAAFKERMGAVAGTDPERLKAMQEGSPSHQLKEFSAALENFTVKIAEPLERVKLAATGPLVDILNSISNIITSIPPDTMDGIAKALFAMAGAFVAIGAAEVIAGAMLLLPGAPVALAIAGLGALIPLLATLDWAKIRSEFQWLYDFFNKLANTTWSKIQKFFALPEGGMGEGGAPLKGNTLFMPGTSQQVLQPIQMALNIDGRTLAQAMSTAMEDLYNHPNGAAAPNGWDNFRSVDSNTTTT